MVFSIVENLLGISWYAGHRAAAFRRYRRRDTALLRGFRELERLRDRNTNGRLRRGRSFRLRRRPTDVGSAEAAVEAKIGPGHSGA
jgi:hypothetical protein